ncbi:hypothetical protein LJR090_001575 [Bosea sp. LjRoot90]
MEVGILVSAGTSPRVFDLRGEMREQIVAFLQPAHGALAPVTAVQ